MIVSGGSRHHPGDKGSHLRLQHLRVAPPLGRALLLLLILLILLAARLLLLLPALAAPLPHPRPLGAPRKGPEAAHERFPRPASEGTRLSPRSCGAPPGNRIRVALAAASSSSSSAPHPVPEESLVGRRPLPPLLPVLSPPDARPGGRG